MQASPPLTAQPGDPRRETTYACGVSTENRVVPGRPRPLLCDLRWPSKNKIHGMPTVVGLGNDEAVELIRSQGLRNATGVCFRNTVFQLLLNNAPFSNWLARHKRCQQKDCLICSFQALSEVYHKPEPPDGPLLLFLRLEEFWEDCRKVFWGPRARRKKKLGSLQQDKAGGIPASLLTWLLVELHKSAERDPAEFQAFERIFGRQIRLTSTCTNSRCDYRGLPAYQNWLCEYLDYNASRTNPISMKEISAAYGSTRSVTFDCPDCTAKSTKQYSLRAINLPEVFFVHIARSSEKAHFLLESPITEELAIPDSTGEVVTYELNSLSLVDLGNSSGRANHTFCVVKSRDGKLYELDDSHVSPIASWSHVDKKQRDPVPEQDRLMPAIIAYVRKTGDVPSYVPAREASDDRWKKQFSCPTRQEVRNAVNGTLTLEKFIEKFFVEPELEQELLTHLASVAYFRADSNGTIILECDDNFPPIRKYEPFTLGYAGSSRSSGAAGSGDELATLLGGISFQDQDDPQVEKVVRDIRLALPHVGRQKVVDVLRNHNYSISKTVDELLYGTAEPDVFLDHLPVGYRASVIKAHVLFPGVLIKDIYRVIRKNQFDLDKAFEILARRPKVNVAFVETVGDAEVTTRCEIMPTEASGELHTGVIDVQAETQYAFNIKIWKGRYRGKLRSPNWETAEDIEKAKTRERLERLQRWSDQLRDRRFVDEPELPRKNGNKRRLSDVERRASDMDRIRRTKPLDRVSPDPEDELVDTDGKRRQSNRIKERQESSKKPVEGDGDSSGSDNDPTHTVPNRGVRINASPKKMSPKKNTSKKVGHSKGSPKRTSSKRKQPDVESEDEEF